MIAALSVAWLSVAAGSALGLLVGQRGLGVARIVAALAAMLAILGLFPEAWEGLGFLSILVVAAGFALPAGLERIGQQHAARAHDVAFAGLLAHQLLDGIGLVLLHDNEGVLLALGAHVVPMSAAVVLAFGATREVAIQRGSAMAAAIGLGIAVGGMVPEAVVHTGEPWLAAAASGLLLHIAMHTGPHDHRS